jgi:iron-sulfur cluster repair protein YtfE (RIC family)
MQFAAKSNSAGQQDWNTASLSALIGHIVSVHHEYLKAELPRIQKQLEVVYAANRETDAASWPRFLKSSSS